MYALIVVQILSIDKNFVNVLTEAVDIVRVTISCLRGPYHIVRAASSSHCFRFT